MAYRAFVKVTKTETFSITLPEHPSDTKELMRRVADGDKSLEIEFTTTNTQLTYQGGYKIGESP